MVMNESLEELKEIINNAKEFDKTSSAKVKGIKIFDGWYRWFLNDNSYSKIFDNEDYDGVVQIERSLSDIKRIIELMERVKCVRNETLSDLCHAIEPSGTINSEQGVNTIRAIQRAIMRLVDE